MGKRIILFLFTNILVIATISITIRLFGIEPYLQSNGINYQSLLIFCALFGMTGSFISLLLSKTVAKWTMGLKIINPRTASGQDAEILETVYDISRKARLPKMPEVAIYNSPEVNAFATGPSKSNSLVAVSTGLIQKMRTDEIEGVLGHEVAHIANGDMVTMTLIQGVVNTFAMFFSRIVAYAISVALSRDNDEGSSPSFMMMWVLTFVFDILFTLLGSILVAKFSRWRELRADVGGAKLVGKDKMIAALQRLKATVNDLQLDQAKNQAISNTRTSNKSSMFALFSSHPPLEKRISILGKMKFV